MSDDLRQVEDVLASMRRRGEACPPAPPADFADVRRHMQRIRRRQLVQRVSLAGAALALAAGVAALIVVQADPGASAGRPAGSAPPPPVLAGAPPPPTAPPALVRLEPSSDLVVFADAADRVTFPSAERMVLSAGTAALRLRPASGRTLTIETPSAKVVVTGTVLSVSVEPAGTGVAVLRGHVRLLAGGRTVELAERQRVVAGSVAVEALPDDDVARLAALFPDEPPPATVASAAPPSPPTGPVPPAASPGRDGGAASGTPVQVSPATPPAEPSLDEAYRAAEVAMRDGRYAEAAELLRGILGRVPAGSSREETALFDLAEVCDRTGDTGCRRGALEAYLDRHPSGAMREDARLGLCRLLQRAGSRDELRSCLERYLAEFPNARQADWARELLGSAPPAPPVAPPDEG